MSYNDVYKSEMTRSRLFDDEWPAGDPALAALAEDLRTVAGGPAPEPRVGLLAVMSQGPPVLIDSSHGRRKMLVKTLVGSLAAKVAFGMGVAAASVTAAGAGGVLPDPAQHAVASIVSAATPFAVPDPATVAPDVRGDREKSSEKSKAKPAVTDDDEAGDDESGARTLNHGACVSAVAKTKAETGSNGKTVSSVARSDCGKTDSTTSTTLAGSTTTSSTSTTIVTANSNRGNSGNSGNSGNGSSGNSGRGKSGKP